MNEKGDVKKAVAELIDNLGTIGLFMLSESRSFLRKSWGSSREEFMKAVDQTARTMKQSGQMAVDDVERTAEQLKKSWELLNREKNLEWDTFFEELKSRLKTMGTVTQETFDLCVNQAKEVLDKQWEATGRLGEEQLKVLQKQSEQMAEAMKGQWKVFWDQMQKTGSKIDRAMDAAWEELKKKD